ncbi:MAG TPA: winged helix-turn-helix domain-containing protein [Gammaproteobacteria bacterium]|nr:winged helix-turn-helix domain-containing protein [Gammaproteobacteria bacterium]
MIRFGSFELDSARHQLRRDGKPAHLGPKAFELLTLLVDASPSVVAKAELHERLWPRGVVSDATLVALVKELRRALNDRDRRHPVIRTVHRVGYAFELPVLREAQPAVSSGHWLITGERRLPLASGENIVGRTAQAHVFVDHPTVSRRHARIVVAGLEARVEDLASKNGTSVGGTPVAAPFTLRDGDWVSFGQAVLTYRRSDRSPSTVTQLSRVDGVRPTK